jgi:hypothetical protein
MWKSRLLWSLGMAFLLTASSLVAAATASAPPVKLFRSHGDLMTHLQKEACGGAWVTSETGSAIACGRYLPEIYHAKAS